MLVLNGSDQPVTGGALTALAKRLWGDDLPAMKIRAIEEIDASAEMARRRFITIGAGQAMEYMATEAEARDFDAGGAGPWPFLEAEREALGEGTTLAQVSAAVLAQVNAWKVAGGEIKRLRRAAKMAIEAAVTPAAVASATVVAWPAPG